MNDTETPRIYAACLSSYSNGLLHGTWIDCDRDSDEIMADIKAMLSRSPMAKVEACEEWAIHSDEGFKGITIGEYESIDRVVGLAQKLKEHGEAFAAYLDHYNVEDIKDFEDRYCGSYDNKQAFTEEHYSELIDKVEQAGLNPMYIDAHRQGLKNRKLSKSFYERSTSMARCIPMGQPILVGHHSEKRDRRFRNRLWDLMGKSVAANDKAEYYEQKAEAIESNRSISSDDPDAIEKLKEKIAEAIARQDFMKAGNKIVKSKKLTIEQKIEQLEAAGHSAMILQPDFCGRIGYADYELTNNNANIRRIKQRLEQLEKALINAVDIGDTEEEYPDLDLIVRHARTINRVQLIFSGKPSVQIRNLLKSHGFRWAPSEGAWQRHLTGFGCRYTLNAIETILQADR